MKITRQQLRRIIKEELSRVSEAGPGIPPTHPLDPGGVESELAQKMAAIDPLYDEFGGDFTELAHAIVELEYGGYGGIIGQLVTK
jgi:hypothetical protein